MYLSDRIEGYSLRRSVKKIDKKTGLNLLRLVSHEQAHYVRGDSDHCVRSAGMGLPDLWPTQSWIDSSMPDPGMRGTQTAIIAHVHLIVHVPRGGVEPRCSLRRPLLLAILSSF
jgi:hypothetical protein